MPNICEFTMKIVGRKKENVEKLVQYLNNKYYYVTDAANHDLNEEDRKKYPFCISEGNWKLYATAEKHFYRVFDVYPGDIEPVDNKWGTVVFGDCAWSVLVCMIDSLYSYFNGNKNEPLREHATTLENVSRDLDLDVEVVSCEPGMTFAEHILISKGAIVKDECFDYEEYCLDDHKSKDEAEKEYGIRITDAEWAQGGYISRCEINPNDPEWSI